MSDDKYAADLAEFQAILDGGLFTVERVHEHSLPHPYCITPDHVGHAADHFGGMLGKEAIESLEKSKGQGCCGMYEGPRGGCDTRSRYGYSKCMLLYDEHVTQKILLVKLTRDLGNKEASAEIFKAKALMVKKGYEGIGFTNLDKEFTIAKPEGK